MTWHGSSCMQREIFHKIPNEIMTKFYGCGSPLPFGIEGLRVLDLGSGSGRDCYGKTPSWQGVNSGGHSWHSFHWGHKKTQSLFPPACTSANPPPQCPPCTDPLA